jgi:hypothetical protein
MNNNISKKNPFLYYLSDWLFRNNLLSYNDKLALNNDLSLKDSNYIINFLLQENIIDKYETLRFLSNYYQIPSIDVIGIFFDHYLVRLFPKDVMLRYYFIPYERDLDFLTIIAANPNDPYLLETIAEYISHDITFMVSIADDIKDSIEEFYDESNTYQPYSIANQKMERSMIDVNPSDELRVKDHTNENIPIYYEDNVDDYERG